MNPPPKMSFLEICAAKTFAPYQPVPLKTVQMYVGLVYADQMSDLLRKYQQAKGLSFRERHDKMQEDLIDVQFQPAVASALEHLLSLSDCTTAAFYEMAESVYEHMCEGYLRDLGHSYL